MNNGHDRKKQMKKQRLIATWLFVLLAGMMLTTVKNVFAAEHQSAVKPNIVLFLVILYHG